MYWLIFFILKLAPKHRVQRFIFRTRHKFGSKSRFRSLLQTTGTCSRTRLNTVFLISFGRRDGHRRSAVLLSKQLRSEILPCVGNELWEARKHRPPEGLISTDTASVCRTSAGPMFPRSNFKMLSFAATLDLTFWTICRLLSRAWAHALWHGGALANITSTSMELSSVLDPKASHTQKIKRHRRKTMSLPFGQITINSKLLSPLLATNFH